MHRAASVTSRWAKTWQAAPLSRTLQCMLHYLHSHLGIATSEPAKSTWSATNKGRCLVPSTTYALYQLCKATATQACAKNTHNTASDDCTHTTKTAGPSSPSTYLCIYSMQSLPKPTAYHLHWAAGQPGTMPCAANTVCNNFA